MDVDVEQCRENDLIKKIIGESGLKVKLIKILLRLSDAIYINGINYNVIIHDNGASLLLISSKPENKTGNFHTISLSNVFYKLRDIEKENEDIKTKLEVHDNMLQIILDIS